MPNKVLVAGASGLLAVAAVEAFLSSGWDVVGTTPGVLNVLPAIGAYAAIRREKGEPFSFPGGPSFVWEAADAGLVADAMAWVVRAPQAANEAFNIGANVRAGRAAFGRYLAPGGSPAVGVTA